MASRHPCPVWGPPPISTLGGLGSHFIGGGEGGEGFPTQSLPVFHGAVSELFLAGGSRSRGALPGAGLLGMVKSCTYGNGRGAGGPGRSKPPDGEDQSTARREERG